MYHDSHCLASTRKLRKSFEYFSKSSATAEVTMQNLKYLPQRLFSSSDYAVVLLNREIQLEDEFFLKIWNNAIVRHVIDGGTNHFFNFLDRQPENVKNCVKYPDFASGDFDSITDESMTRLRDPVRSKCKVVLTEDQDETDFTKGLRVIRDEFASKGCLDKLKSVVTICEFSGRLDQILGNLNTLHKNVFMEDFSQLQPTVYLMGSDNLSWLLPAKYENTIGFENEKPNITCGVMPLQGPTTYISKGLQWDLTPDMVCQFGGLVSTSNKIVEQVLKIKAENNHSILGIEMHTKDYVL